MHIKLMTVIIALILGGISGAWYLSKQEPKHTVKYVTVTGHVSCSPGVGYSTYDDPEVGFQGTCKELLEWLAVNKGGISAAKE